MTATALGPAQPDPRLDEATHTVSPRSGPWSVAIWDAAGEVSGCWNTGAPPERPESKLDPDHGGPLDPERSAIEAARRASSTIRRYVVSHGCTRQVTLTYAPEHLPASLEEGWADIEDFRRKMGKKVGPMLIVPEWGEKSGRFHWHALVPKYQRKSVYEEAWGRGWVDIRRIKSNRSDGPRGARSDARTAARYASKYLAKTFRDGQEGRKAGGKRYSTTKGTKVEPRRLRFQTRDQALTFATRVVAGGMANVTGMWSSEDQPDWEGPPVWLIHFDSEPPPGMAR